MLNHSDNQTHKKENKLLNELDFVSVAILSTISIIISFQLFYQLSLGNSDYPAHIRFALQKFQAVDGVGPKGTGYTIIHSLLLFLSPKPINLASIGATITVLSVIAVSLKCLISASIISAKNQVFNCVLALSMVLAAPIYNFYEHEFYLGQFTPTFWHNPTSIITYPLNFLTFVYTLAFTKHPSWRYAITLTVLGVSSSLVKPSFVFAFYPAFSIYLLIVFRDRLNELFRIKYMILFVFLVPLAIMSIQFALTFFQGSTSIKGSGLIFSPFSVWNVFSKNIPISLFLSLAFPLTVLVAYGKKALRDSALFFAWILFLSGLIEAICLAESGTRFAHGNLFWGGSLALTILFLFNLRFLVRDPQIIRKLICYGIFALHVISGIFYYAKLVNGGSYY